MAALTPDRWRDIQTLFSALVDAPADEQARQLAAAAAADPELAATVRGMLDHATGGPRLQQLIDEAAESLSAAETTLPVRFGAYRVVREVGRGGMGVVYEGVSDDEFARRVAIKVAPLARVGAAVDARFRLERQILSSLEHPHIARFLDGGAEGALPYFVMEFVQGESITSYVTRKALPLADRLRLVQTLCGALQYAHQRLVVHRDLKPANILVTDDGTPKLLDFGVAKLMDPSATGTQTIGGMAWTPDYASPEQVTGEFVGTPADVYALGLVLYEVLTGLRAQSTDTSSPLALTRSVCEVDPVRPSVRVAASGDRALARRLEGDLDTIVMTAIQKDPAQRYASASALADDIERYLHGLPVEARAGSIWYRARKAVARHRGVAAAASLVTIAVVGGFISTAYQARRADRRFQQVRALANEFVFGVHDRIATLPGSTEARRALVQTALTYLENLREDAADDPGLAKELADAYVKVGRVQGHPLSANLGEPAAAIANYGRARDLLTPLEAAGDFDARLTLARLELQAANLLRSQGDVDATDASFARARQLAESARAARPADEGSIELVGEVNAEIARTATDRHSPAEIAAAAERALEAVQALLALHPGDAYHRDNLATAHHAVGSARLAQGQLETAVANFRSAAEIREKLVQESPANNELRRGLVVALGNLGDVLGVRSGENIGDLEGAAAAFERAVAISRDIAAGDPKDRRAAFDVVNAQMRLGTVLGELAGRVADGVVQLEEASTINVRLLGEEPGSARYGFLQIVLDRRLGHVYRVAGRAVDADTRLQRVRAGAVKYFDGPSGNNARLQSALAGAELALLLAERRDPRATAMAATARTEIAQAKLAPVLEAQARADLGRAFALLAREAAAASRATAVDAAVAEFDASVAAWQRAPASAPVVAQRDRALAQLAADRESARAAGRR